MELKGKERKREKRRRETKIGDGGDSWVRMMEKREREGMPQGLIRKRLDWFDSKANNATSRASRNIERRGRD